MLQSHYSSTLDFSNAALQAAEKGFVRMMNLFETLKSLVVSNQNDFDFNEFETKCYTAMNDDFNTPILLAHLFDGGKFINSVKAGSSQIDKETKLKLVEFYRGLLFDVLGFLSIEEKGNNELINFLMTTIIDVRNTAKKNKNFAQSDAIRDKLTTLGITLKDSREGTDWEIN